MPAQRFPRCYFHPGYEYRLPPEHPFPMEKFRWGDELLRKVLPGFSSQIPDSAPDEAIRRIHHPEYLRCLKEGGMPSDAVKRMGLPLRTGPEGLYERSCREVSGTLATARAAIMDGMACNLAGGTHHAYPDRGSGYCVLNDVAISIAELRQDYPDWRYLVVDTDAHQGNGTNAIFKEDPNVFTYSIHVGANFPSQKEPGSLDVPLPRWVHAMEYLEALDASLPVALERFKPDFVFWIAGADPHKEDRFGQMQLSTGDMDERNRRVLEWIEDAHVPLATLFGGGYHKHPIHTARLHVRAVLQTMEILAERHEDESTLALCRNALLHPDTQVA